MRLRSARFAPLVVFASLAATAPAWGQSDADRSTARSLGQDGAQALDGKDYKTAEDRFRRADKLVHAPTLLLGLARALAGEGKYVESQETYERILREGVAPGAPDPFVHALADAKREVDAISAKVGGVTITIKSTVGGDVPDPKVVLDGHPVNAASLGVRRSIDPGAHVLQVSADGYAPAEVKFAVTEGASVNQPVTLDKAATVTPPPAVVPPPPLVTPPPPPPTVPPEQPQHGGARAALPWVAFGVGGAGLAVGVVTGFIAVGKHSDLSNACTNGNCTADQKSNLDSYHTVGAISTVGFIVAGVGAAAGLVLLLTQPHDEPPVSTAPPPPAARLRIAPAVGVSGPSSIGVVGSF